MRHVENVGRKRYRPLGTWDRIPGGVRGALVLIPVMVGFYLVNSVGLTLFSNGLTAGLICYPVQMLLYGLTGFVSGAQARGSHLKANRTVGRVGERVQRTHPNYVVQGAVGGLVMGLFGLIVYFAAGTAVINLLPWLSLFVEAAGSTSILFLFVDFFVCIGLGIIGGLVYHRVGG